MNHFSGTAFISCRNVVIIQAGYTGDPALILYNLYISRGATLMERL